MQCPEGKDERYLDGLNYDIIVAIPILHSYYCPDSLSEHLTLPLYCGLIKFITQVTK